MSAVEQDEIAELRSHILNLNALIARQGLALLAAGERIKLHQRGLEKIIEQANGIDGDAGHNTAVAKKSIINIASIILDMKEG